MRTLLLLFFLSMFGFGQRSPENLMPYSETLTQNVWNNPTSKLTLVTGAAVNPVDGSMTASKLVETSETGNHFIYQVLAAVPMGQSYTFSVLAMAAERSIITLYNPTVGYGATFDLSSGNLMAPVFGGLTEDASIKPVVGYSGWYRCSITVPVDVAGNAWRIYLQSSATVYNYAGDVTKGLYVTAVQLSRDALKPYAKTVASTKVAGVTWTLSSPDPTPATADNTAAPITIPTYDLTGYATHPDVLYFASGWNGHSYWMVMTPYNGAAVENPSILVSADGTTWTVPAGLTNPVVAAPGGSTYNSDPCIFMSVDGLTMYLVWRTYTSTVETIYEISSTDGVTWSAPITLFSITSAAADQSVSPTVQYNSTTGMFEMWATSGRWSIYRRTSPTPSGPWSDPQECYLFSKMRPDHIFVKIVNGVYYSLVSNNPGGFYLFTSTDGIRWRASSTSTPVLADRVGQWNSGASRGLRCHPLPVRFRPFR